MSDITLTSCVFSGQKMTLTNTSDLVLNYTFSQLGDGVEMFYSSQRSLQHIPGLNGYGIYFQINRIKKHQERSSRTGMLVDLLVMQLCTMQKRNYQCVLLMPQIWQVVFFFFNSFQFFLLFSFVFMFCFFAADCLGPDKSPSRLWPFQKPQYKYQLSLLEEASSCLNNDGGTATSNMRQSWESQMHISGSRRKKKTIFLPLTSMC